MIRSTKRTSVRRLAAAVGAAALAVAAVAVTAAPASAADPYDLPSDPGSLTIHKFEQPSPSGPVNDEGATIDTSGWVPLGNVEFTVTPITNVDLTTEAGWDLANDYAADPSDPSIVLGTPITLTTDAAGTAAFASLPNGAYLVEETDSSGATLPDGSPANVAVESAPFVVTVPIPLGDGQWNSDVHVYPKNSLTAVEKSVDAPDGNGLGSTVTWTVGTEIPTLADGETFSEFHIVDTLDNRLEYVDGSATVTINGVAVAATVTHLGAALGGTLEVTIDPAGLADLAANGGETLTLSFDTIVRGAGDIPNTATVYVNNPTTEPGIDSNTVDTYWGPVQITKHAEGDTSAVLEGAVFTVHASAADAAAGINPIVVDVAGTPTTEFTTQDDGTVLIPGLWAGSTATGSMTYYLREVEAPAGYILSTTPIEVVVSASTVASPVVVAVPNPQEPAISLPLTGGSGTIVLMTAGIGLVAAAVGVSILAARRRRAAAHTTTV